MRRKRVPIIRSCILFFFFCELALLCFLQLGQLATSHKSPLKDSEVRLNVLVSDGYTLEATLDSYLVGVMEYYMLPSDSQAAYEAACVAARTFYWYAVESGRHTEANAVCDDEHCCLGVRFLTRRQRANEATSSPYCIASVERSLKIKRALLKTDRMILGFNGKPAYTPFFAYGSVKTRSGKEAGLGKEGEWLVSAATPESSFVYYQNFDISMQQVIAKLQAFCGDASIGYADYKNIKIISVEESGYPAEIEIGGNVVTAEGFRKVFGLNSTFFTIRLKSRSMRIIDCGDGLGVGMSLRGASLYGTEGMGYRDILRHYYPNYGLMPKQ